MNFLDDVLGRDSTHLVPVVRQFLAGVETGDVGARVRHLDKAMLNAQSLEVGGGGSWTRPEILAFSAIAADHSPLLGLNHFAEYIPSGRALRRYPRSMPFSK